MSKSGKVYLVGAGPWRSRLGTLRGQGVRRECGRDHYDHLANPETLGWARDDAEIIYVVKRLANRGAPE